MTFPLPPTNNPRLRRRLPLLALAVLALLAGLWAGLIRLGWPLPVLPLRLPAQHGPLMVTGFLGTLISLERAIALSAWQEGRAGAYLAPLLAGAGAVLLLAAVPPAVPRALATLGALGMVLIFAVIVRLQPTLDHAVMGLGALMWLVGNGLWLAGQPVYRAVPWWAGFLVLTIAGERLELARVLQLSPGVRRLFLLIVSGLALGVAATLVTFDAGMRLAGLALLALGAWLLRYDVARRTVRRRGLTRYIAACLLPGYAWLAGGGLLWLWIGGQRVAGPVYDSLLHLIFVGFVISMILGHAPIILPAVLGAPVPFSRWFYLPLGLLHTSLGLRLAGDLLASPPARRWGGLWNEAAILLFLLFTAAAVLRGRRQAGGG